MKAFIKTIIFSVLAFILLSSTNPKSGSIPDLEVYAKKVLEVYLTQNEIFIKEHILLTENDIQQIALTVSNDRKLRNKPMGAGGSDFSNVSLVKAQNADFMESYRNVNKKMKLDGIQIKSSEVQINQIRFEINKTKYTDGLTFGSVEVYFTANNKEYVFEITNAILVSNQWKLGAIREINDIEERKLRYKEEEAYITEEVVAVDSVAPAVIYDETIVADSAVAVPEEYRKTDTSSEKKSKTTKPKSTVKKATGNK